MTSNVVVQFNKVLSSFLIQIVSIVGSTYHSNIQKIIKYNSALPVEIFLYYAIEYRDKILKRDNSYFLDDTVITSNIEREYKLDEIF